MVPSRAEIVRDGTSIINQGKQRNIDLNKDTVTS